MKGLELSRKYYETWGDPMLRNQFPACRELLAAGLAGSGSECYGYDDDISRDHDFEPGFCLFLPGEELIDRRTAFQLERAYAKLPDSFEGYARLKLGPVGGRRHGVIRWADFLRDRIGCEIRELTPMRWLQIPDYALSETINGEVFLDERGWLTADRALLAQMPEDVRRKKLAGHLLMMAQSGQYNYRRCLEHGETGAAQLAISEFVRHTMASAFLLHRSYMPYYKWAFRALSALSGAEDLARSLEWLLSTGNEGAMADEKAFCLEGIASAMIEELQKQDLTKADCGDLEKHAYSVNDGIRDGEIRNLHILAAADT